MPERVLVVEDESTLCANVARYLSGAGHTVTAVQAGRAAMRELDERSFDVVITDLRLPDVDGLAVLDCARATSPDTAVLIMTAYASVDSAVGALRRGAHDYILKPLSLAELRRKVENIAEHRRLRRENARLRTLQRGDASALALLRAGGTAMNDLCDLIDRVAPSSSNVLVVGETGTGKELVARAIHERSPRADGPFVTMDVSAIPDALIESYLFGHERGAFAGAERHRDGLFRTASGGTLFLDEVGELPLAVQAKLLRAVESKEVLPVGADRGLCVDVRIVAATHRHLAQLVEDGRFRQDLMYRLQVMPLQLPPLRDRLADVPRLAAHFVEVHARAQRKAVRAIAPDAVALLTHYPWPGNVRELSNVIERAVILASKDVVTPADLPAELGQIKHRPVAPILGARAGAVSAIGVGSDTEEASDLDTAVLAFQRTHIARVLDRVHGSREAAARLLGLSSATLYRHLQRVGLKGYGLDDDANTRSAS